MRLKFIEVNEDGLIQFSAKELEALVEEAYNEGFEDGKKAGTVVFPTIEPPVNPYKPYVTWTTTPCDPPYIATSTGISTGSKTVSNTTNTYTYNPVRTFMANPNSDNYWEKLLSEIQRKG